MAAFKSCRLFTMHFSIFIFTCARASSSGFDSKCRFSYDGLRKHQQIPDVACIPDAGMSAMSVVDRFTHWLGIALSWMPTCRRSNFAMARLLRGIHRITVLLRFAAVSRLRSFAPNAFHSLVEAHHERRRLPGSTSRTKTEMYRSTSTAEVIDDAPCLPLDDKGVDAVVPTGRPINVSR